MRELQDMIRAWVPSDYATLGTDGWGMSDTRGALRRHFLVDAAEHHRAHAGLASPSAARSRASAWREAIERYHLTDPTARPTPATPRAPADPPRRLRLRDPCARDRTGVSAELGVHLPDEDLGRAAERGDSAAVGRTVIRAASPVARAPAASSSTAPRATNRCTNGASGSVTALAVGEARCVQPGVRLRIRMARRVGVLGPCPTRP